jgi:hypothetical protein
MQSFPVEHTQKPISFDVSIYQAPFLIEKLLKDCIIDNTEEGEQLFAEVKRWMLLSQLDKSKIWEMYSYRIDEVWHQFILFTDEYMKFCDRYFGAYFSHSPGNAPGNSEKDDLLTGSFGEFKQLYEKTFKTELPTQWFDEKSININRRVLNYNVGKFFLEDKDGRVNMINDNGGLVLSINLFARDAIAFIAATKAFYVRELPGELTNEEKIFLITSLVEFHILRVAS